MEGFPTETSVLMMVFGILEERLKWQKVRMRAEDIVWIEDTTKSLVKESIRPEFLGKVLVA